MNGQLDALPMPIGSRDYGLPPQFFSSLTIRRKQIQTAQPSRPRTSDPCFGPSSGCGGVEAECVAFFGAAQVFMGRVSARLAMAGAALGRKDVTTCEP